MSDELEVDEVENSHGLWFQLFADIAHNPKTLHLEQLVGDAALTYYVRLASACVADRRYRFSGRMPAEKIEAVCRWRGERGALLTAFVDSELLDRDTLAIHDWTKHSGRLLKKMEEKRERDRERAANKSKDKPPRELAASSPRARRDLVASPPRPRDSKSEYPSPSEKGGNIPPAPPASPLGSGPASPGDAAAPAPYDGHAVMLAAGTRQNLSHVLPIADEAEMRKWEKFLNERCPVDNLEPELARQKRDRFVGRALELMLQLAASEKYGSGQGSLPPDKKFTIATPAAFIREYAEMVVKFPSKIVTPEQLLARDERRRERAESEAQAAADLEEHRRRVDLVRIRYEELLALEPANVSVVRKSELRARAAEDVSSQLAHARAGPAAPDRDDPSPQPETSGGSLCA